MRSAAVTLAAVAAVLGTAALATSAPADDPPAEDYGAAAAGCSVTETQVVHVPRTPGPAPGWLAGNRLWLGISTDSAIVLGTHDGRGDGSGNAYPGDLSPDGSVRVKFLWYRAKDYRGKDHREKDGTGRLWVIGRKQPGSRGFRTVEGEDFPHRKVVPSGVVFPSPGCWSVAAKTGRAKLRFLVWVAVEQP